jgi:ArsR family transcriptional regulator
VKPIGGAGTAESQVVDTEPIEERGRGWILARRMKHSVVTSKCIEVLSQERYDCSMDSSMVVEMTNLDQRAGVLKAIADPSRLEILEVLSPEIRCNCRLQEVLDLAPNLLSYHLKVLREAGLIEETKRGRWVDYALTSDAHARIAVALPRDLAP